MSGMAELSYESGLALGRTFAPVKPPSPSAPQNRPDYKSQAVSVYNHYIGFSTQDSSGFVSAECSPRMETWASHATLRSLIIEEYIPENL
jgi:hypothetical protein